MVNVLPENDEQEHIEDVHCWCEPKVEYRDEDGEYVNGPLIVHNAEDGRETVENATGESMAEDKQWLVVPKE